MQSTTITGYQAQIATLFDNFCNKARAACRVHNYPGAQVLIESANELLAVLQGQSSPTKRPGRPPREAAATTTASTETTAHQQMNDDQFVAWLETQASPVPLAIALNKTGWTSNRLNLRGGVLEKAGRIVIEGKGKNKFFRPPAARLVEQQGAAAA